MWNVNSIKYKQFRITWIVCTRVLASDSWKEIFSKGNNEVERFSRFALQEQLKNGLPKDGAVAVVLSSGGTNGWRECHQVVQEWSREYAFPGPKLDNCLARWNYCCLDKVVGINLRKLQVWAHYCSGFGPLYSLWASRVKSKLAQG
jgi:hypothetical protein